LNIKWRAQSHTQARSFQEIWIQHTHQQEFYSTKKASIFCQRREREREREREITFGEEFGTLPDKNLKKIKKLCFKINLTLKAAGRKIERGMACI
jgi:tRNA(Leu) C34 or U34 (ribose-2'-O)-methylase TrmL